MTERGASLKPVTIQDVAAAAGVSAQTVSRVINGKAEVSPTTRERVLEVVQRLGYRTNAVARSLVSQRTHTLGIITALHSDPFASEVVMGAEAEARRRGYVCILTYTDGSTEAVRSRCTLYEERRVDGLLLVAPAAVPHDPIAFRLPSVALAYPVLDGLTINVDVDNIDGGYQAMSHLTALGHRRIGIIGGPPGWLSAADRDEGARRALASVGAAFDDAVRIASDWTGPGGYASARTILDAHPEVTALFCHNDIMAIGACRLLRERGLRIPEDMSVIGFDDLSICSFMSPPLTTVRQPRDALGQLLVQLLIDAVEGNGRFGQEVLVRTELVLRESTAPPRVQSA